MISLAIITHAQDTSTTVEDLITIVKRLGITSYTSFESNDELAKVMELRNVRNKDLVVVHPHYTGDYSIEGTNTKNIILISGAYDKPMSTSSSILKLPRHDDFEQIESIFRELNSAKDAGENLHSFFIQMSKKIADDSAHESKQVSAGTHSEANKWGGSLLARLMIDKGYFAAENSEQILRELNDASRYEGDLMILKCPLFNFPVKTKEPLWVNSRILFIDDQHERGWSTLLAHIIHGDSTRLTRKKYFHNLLDEECIDEVGFFTAAKWDESRSIRDSIKKNTSIQKKFGSNFPFDIVFLDYRLFDLEEKADLPENMSGARLAREIREYDPSVPIIGVSASVKRSGFEAMQPLFYFYEKRKSIVREQQIAPLIIRDFENLEYAIGVAKNTRWIRAINYIYQVAINTISFKTYNAKPKATYSIENESMIVTRTMRELIDRASKKSAIEKLVPNEFFMTIIKMAEQHKLYNAMSKHKYFKKSNRNLEIVWHLLRLRNDVIHGDKVDEFINQFSTDWTLLFALELLYAAKKSMCIEGNIIERYISIDDEHEDINILLKEIISSYKSEFTTMFEKQVSKEKAKGCGEIEYYDLYLATTKIVGKCLGINDKYYETIKTYLGSSMSLDDIISNVSINEDISGSVLLCASIRTTDVKNKYLASACFHANQYAFAKYLGRNSNLFESPQIILIISRILSDVAYSAIASIPINP